MALRQEIFRYGWGICLFAIALGLRFAAEPFLPPGFPFLTFFPAVIVAAFMGGMGPAIVCAVLSGLAALYFFIPPERSFHIDGRSGVAVAFFAIIVTVDIIIIDRLTKALAAFRLEREKAVHHAEQRDTLFKELQHRIGNNLQSVSALLNVQMRAVGDPAAKRALADAVQRVAIIADIHRMFHDPARADGRIDESFVRELAERCIATAGASDRTRLVTDIQPVVLQQDRFLPVALVLTECVNNALEHGIGSRSEGTISVTLARVGQSCTLEVRDDGPGLPPGFDPATARSIGMTVLKAFSAQLGGRFTMASDNGTVCRLVFDAPPIVDGLDAAWPATGPKAAHHP